MTEQYEKALENTLASLDQMTDSLDGVRVTEAVFCLERIVGRAKEMVADLQCDTPRHERA